MRPVSQRLLFVHPDPTQCRAFEAAFGYGFQVTTAPSGKAAVRAANRDSYPIVIIDDRIRDTDPWTLVQLIAPVSPTSAFVVVAEEGRLVRQAGRPVAATLTHPWTEDHLRSTLARVVEKQKRWLQPTQNAARKRILLVDDADDVSLVRSALNRLGWRVTHRNDMDGALTALEDEPFRAVLTSASLPKVQGPHAVRTLVTAAPDTPVIVLTEHGDPDLETQCVRVGAQDCLVKGSSDLVLLGRVLRHAIERQAAVVREAPQPRVDPATGLMNRQGFLDVLHRTVSRCGRTGSRFAVLYLDVDRFRALRETLGREPAETLLREVGDRLTEAVRVYDAVARIGPDDFAIVLDELKDAGEEVSIAERLISRLSTPIRVGARRVNLCASIGIAVYPEAGDTVTQLLEKAECAMYAAKSRGGSSHWVYVPEAKRLRMAQITDLQEALEAGRLDFDYQPQIALGTGELTGFEALLRWRRPDGTVVMPNVTLPLLEESGLIHEVGARSIGWALDRLGTLRADPKHAQVRVAINVSPSQFENPDFARRVEAALDAYGLAADALELEISESLLMADAGHTRKMLSSLTDLGVRIMIDNFGTGVSSLPALRALSVTGLKIDRSFVAELSDSEDARTIADAIIGLGRRLGLEVVAEGIETEDQRALLASFGCQTGQGYLFGRPGRIEDCVDEMGQGAFSVRLTG